ncbi:MAG: hypothetical protein QX203_00315 [Methylococcaceae bacterium]
MWDLPRVFFQFHRQPLAGDGFTHAVFTEQREQERRVGAYGPV